MGLRVRFALTSAVLVFLLAGVFGVVTAQFSVDQLRDRIGQSLATDASRIADRLNREMAGRSRELALVGALDPLRNFHDPAEVQGLLDSLRRSVSDYLWLAVTDPQGRVVTATDGSLLGSDLSNRSDIRDMLRGRPNRNDDPLRVVRPGDPDPGPLPNAGARPINISHPIRSADGKVVGVIVAQLSWDWVRELVRSLLTTDDDGQLHRQTFLISNDDTVLAGPPGTVGTWFKMPVVNQARAGILGWSVETWPDGKAYLTGVGFAAGEGQFPGPGSAPMRWTVLVRELPQIAFAPARHMETSIIITGFLLAIGVAIIGWIVAGLITRPLSQIADAADRLRQGEAVEMPAIRGAIEVEKLSASLRALVDALTFNQVKLDEMQSVARHDPLTGVMNRSGLEAWLAAQEMHARAKPSGLLVLIGDLDGFKQVNDTMGHGAGDLLLQEVGRRFQGAVRAGDAVARLGGDEFVVVLQAPLGLADSAAVETANRVWTKVAEPYRIGDTLVTIGFSMGGAGWPEDDPLIDMVMQMADRALYAAKRAGKGRIAFHREPGVIVTQVVQPHLVSGSGPRVMTAGGAPPG
jgi:diguanylate cyclase (GGDEF)-like protein